LKEHLQILEIPQAPKQAPTNYKGKENVKVPAGVQPEIKQ
jgi:hypothetical protein